MIDGCVRCFAKTIGASTKRFFTHWFGRTVRTGIWKSPVDGRVAVRGVNLDGDDQADRRVHGGPDKAVYAYASEDYAWWADQGDDVGPGTFGENLTTEGIDLSTFSSRHSSSALLC